MRVQLTQTRREVRSESIEAICIVVGLMGEGFVIRIGFEIVAIKKVYMHV